MVFISEEIENLKVQLSEKDSKLKNQAAELNHLTNEIIPELKKENKKLKALKIELTDALETSTKKYFDQLEINADLSDSVAKKGAALQLSKVRIEEIEKLVAQIDEECKAEVEAAEAKVKNLENSIKEAKGISPDVLKEVDSLKNKVSDLEAKLKSKDKDLKDTSKNLANLRIVHEKSDDIIKRLQSDVDKLNALIKEKDESLKNSEGLRGQIAKLEAELKDRDEKLDAKIREYDKLSTSVKSKEKEINVLKAKNDELIAAGKPKAKPKKGFFSRFG
ncbi:MAG: hypothetical protein Q4P14_04380 [Methanobacteriaceae archaeon]|nr:hypothetical protein [Methanobacteriaceae archaeon]